MGEWGVGSGGGGKGDNDLMEITAETNTALLIIPCVIQGFYFHIHVHVRTRVPNQLLPYTNTGKGTCAISHGYRLIMDNDAHSS